MRFWLEERSGARIGEVDLPVKSYTNAPVNILWMNRLFYLQASDGGGYREALRPMVVSDAMVKLIHPSAIEPL